jgi:hypothetical protein
LHGGAAKRRAVAIPLWQVWWLWGAGLACAVSGLLLIAEDARLSGSPVVGDLLDVVRLALYWVWAWAVWKTAPNVRRRIWIPVARILALAGVGLMFLV